MGKKVFTLANVMVILYVLATYYDVPHKWAWLGLSAVVLGVVLVLWNSSAGRTQGNP